MRGFRRILVAVKQPGRSSSPAIAKAEQLARSAGAAIELFHALAAPIEAEPFLYAGGSLVAAERKDRAKALAGLEMIADALRARGVKVSTSAEWDFPAYEAVVRQALRIRADLIVAEHHLGRRLASWILHHNDRELLRLAPMPVLLVKNSQPYRRPTVLAAIDPAHAFEKTAKLDREILRAASDLTGLLHGRLHAMHAYFPLPPVGVMGEILSTNLMGRLHAEARAQARRAFESQLRGSGIPTFRQHLERQFAVEAIPAVATRVGAALVVMGAVSRSGLKRIFIGNTAERVLDELPCDVLVVKPGSLKTPVARARRGAKLVAAPAPMAPF